MGNSDCKSEFLNHRGGKGRRCRTRVAGSFPEGTWYDAGWSGIGLEKKSARRKEPSLKRFSLLASGLTYKTSRGVDAPRDVPFCPLLPDLTALCRSTSCISCRCRTDRGRSGRFWGRYGEPASASRRVPLPPRSAAASVRASCPAAAAAA